MRYEVTCLGSKITWESVDEARESAYYCGDLKLLYIFNEEELKEDIERVATVQGRSMQHRINKNNSRRSDGEDSVYAIATFQEVCEEENWPWSQRVLGLGISEVETALHPIARRKMKDHSDIDNAKEGNIEWLIELNVPDEFSDTMFVKLMRFIHDYLIARVLWEWASLNYVEFSQYWLNKMEMDMTEIRKVSTQAASSSARLHASWVP